MQQGRRIPVESAVGPKHITCMKGREMCKVRGTLRLMTGGKVSKSLFSNGSQNFMTRLIRSFLSPAFQISALFRILVPAGGRGSSLVHQKGDGMAN